jgi:RNA polymerase sigma-54 factor
MALKQEQQLKQVQKLSPLQMQVIKLVELNSVELEDRIKQEVEDNPALETTDPAEPHTDDEYDIQDGSRDKEEEEEIPLSQEEMVLGDYFSEDDVPDYQLNYSSYNESRQRESVYSDEKTLNETLLEQISLLPLNERQKTIAEYIIGNLDENGYLQRDLRSISNDLLLQQHIDASSLEMEDILYEIQDLDPAGVGARNLQECLLLQLQRKEHSPEVKIAEEILTNYFEEFSHKHYEKILRQLNISEEELRKAIDEIVSLNPKPGNSWTNSLEIAMSNITPDFIVESENGEVIMYLNNQNIPDLKVNRDFYEMVQGYNQNKESMSTRDKQAMLFMKQKMDSAKWFIDAVKQRQNTLQRTMEAIVGIQYDFFLTGDETKLKPMILKDVAEKTGFDISTISRVSNSKYVQTNTGIYPLKFFFSEAMQNEAGEDVSSHEIKYILKESIENENPSKPLTDDQLTRILNQKGYMIARRTVAKYREQMNIPVARLRKKI